MKRALECSICKTVQFKGDRCPNDGSVLKECNLEEVNDIKSDYEKKIIDYLAGKNLKEETQLTSIHSSNDVNIDPIIKHLVNSMIDEVEINILKESTNEETIDDVLLELNEKYDEISHRTNIDDEPCKDLHETMVQSNSYFQVDNNSLFRVFYSNEQVSPFFSKQLTPFRFDVAIPLESFARNMNLMMCFMIVDQSNAINIANYIKLNVETRINYKINEQLGLVIFDCNAKMQIDLLKSNHIIYFYYLNNSINNTFFFESNLKNLNLARVFQSKNQDFKIDGLAVFDKFFNNYNERNLTFSPKTISSLKYNYMEYILRLGDNDYLFTPDIFSYYLGLIDQYTNINESLCMNDRDYKSAFEKLISNQIVRFVKYLEKRYQTHYNQYRQADWQCFSILLSFHICSLFSLSLITKNAFMNPLIRLLRTNDIMYLQELSKLYANKQKNFLTQCIEQYLKKYNEKLTQSNAFNLISIYYFVNLEKFQSASNSASIYELKFENPYLQENEIQDNLQFYHQVIQDDKIYATIFINFFCNSSEKYLQMFFSSRIFLNYSFLKYILVTISRIKSQDGYLFDNNKHKEEKIIKKTITSVNDSLLQNLSYSMKVNQDAFRNYDFNNYRDEYELCIRLLTKFIDSFSKETNIIILLIQLAFNYMQLKTWMPDHQVKKHQIELDNMYEDLMDCVQNWIQKEWSKSEYLVGTDSMFNDVEMKNEKSHSNQNAFNWTLKSFRKLVTGQSKEEETEAKRTVDIGIRIFDRLLNVNLDSLNMTNKEIDVAGFRYKLFSILRRILASSSLTELFNNKYKLKKVNDLKNMKEIMFQFDEVIYEKLCFNQENSLNEVFSLANETNLNFIQTLIDRFFTENFLKKSKDIDFILKWKPFLIVLANCFDSRSRIFTQEWLTVFIESVNLIVSHVNKLTSGTIELESIDILKKNVTNLMKIFNFIINKCNFKEIDKFQEFTSSNADYLERLVKLRSDEKTLFIKYHEALMGFQQICSKFEKIDSKSLQNDLIALSKRDFKSIKLNEVCNVKKLTKIIGNSQEAENIDINFFKKITKIEIKIVKNFTSLDRLNCILFDDFFNDNLKNYDQNVEKVPIEIVINVVIPDTFNRWKQVADKINNGSLKLVEIDEFIIGYYSSNYSKFQKEIFYVLEYFKIPNLKERQKQIILYNSFKASVEAARAIEEIRLSLEVKNSFVELNDLLNIHSDQFKLWYITKMDQDAERIIKVLNKINKERQMCLSAFVESIEFVKWLRKNTNDLSQLKFLVDLASTSKANESHTKDLLTKTLKEAGVAFAPLIYDLKSDATFSKFMSLSDIVWQHLSSDKLIANKLLAVKNQISQLEEIKNDSSNVELSRINQAKELNKKGLYKVGNLKALSQFSLNEFNLTDSLENIIELECLIDDISTKTKKLKNFSYESLNELKNILMLMTHKATMNESKVEKTGGVLEVEDDNETLEYFIDVFDNVIRLAQIYLKLINKGCFLFEYFYCTIQCDIKGIYQNNKASVLTIKLNENFTIENKQEDTISSLKKTCQFFEKFYDLWLDYLNTIRSEYDCINLFTVNQIIYLKNNLSRLFLRGGLVNGKINENMKFDYDQCFSLLYTLKNLDTNDENTLIEAFNRSKLEYYNNKKSDRQNKLALNSKSKLNNELQMFAHNFAVDNNYDLVIVKKAVEMFGIGNESDLHDYCMANDNLGIDGQLMDISIHEDEMEVDMIQTDEDYKELMKDLNMKKNFNEKLETLWSIFMTGQNKFNKNDAFINIEHFAIFLEILKQNDNLQAKIKRKSPDYLNRGRPNLIICPVSDQIRIALSIYANSINSPLPTNDEILFCNQDTTYEDLENFFRIAYKSNGEKIYCLMNIQELEYQTSKQIDEFLSKNVNLKSTNQYLLVCICCITSSTSGKQQEQSLLASSLSKFRIEAIIYSDEELQLYLINKFSSQSKLCIIDPDKSNVKALLSQKPGNGKSLYVKNLINSLQINNKNLKFQYKCIRIKSNTLILDDEIKKLFECKKEILKEDSKNQDLNSHIPTVFHIDIAFEVFKNVEKFIFNLTVLGFLKHSNGLIWRRNCNDLYLIEMMPPYLNMPQQQQQVNMNRTKLSKLKLTSYHFTLNYLPQINFRSPAKYFYDLSNMSNEELKKHWNTIKNDDSLFLNFYKTKKFQRVCVYLKEFRENPQQIERINFSRNPPRDHLTELDCLKILLDKDYSEFKNPQWSEIQNFVNFLDEQLETLEECNIFTQNNDELIELKNVCARLSIMMAYDFGLPSLNLNENSNIFNVNSNNEIEFSIEQLNIIRKWESSTHPYMIPNLPDKQSFTFIGIYLDRRQHKFIDSNSNQTMDDSRIDITPRLIIKLLQQKVPIFDNFNYFPRSKKITSLRNVMGLNTIDQMNYDPDPSYELTIDNCLKLMAIFLRLKCNNPVVIMGETGCGKSRKIKFLSDLHLNPKILNFTHLIHFKIHGGTTAKDIEKAVLKAQNLAQMNKRRLIDYNRQKNINNFLANGIYGATAILFFDEANTTEAIGLIKEIMCDLTLNGKPIDMQSGLKLIAAVNPYRKHTQEMIDKLESAGLGFFITANDSKDKLGHIPMRQLVYRVQPLPSSLLSLVFDFGQLEKNAEHVYIMQMLNKAIKNRRIPNVDQKTNENLCELLKASQDFMRNRNDECSFVSLRDIERVIKVTSWFLSKRELIFTRMMNKTLLYNIDESYQNYLDDLYKAFVLALIVCYHSSLYKKETRQIYRRLIAKKILPECNEDWVQYEILKCQHVFLDEVKLNNNIAKNGALLENVFMIIICLELRLPLFIVGKPGSSKSLAKSIVSDAMSGKNSGSELFKNLKESFFVNFQCSPLTRPEMIIKAFKEAASYQENKNLEESVAVVNLDEIGLAEASDSMPLKALHPLLEEGTDESDYVGKPHEKVGVIGISNWALDPAKMNRAIFVSRSEPDIDELIESAKGICKYDDHIYGCIKPYMRDIAKAYLYLCDIAKESKREFFGLRDYYSLIKMLYWFCLKDATFTWHKLEHSVRRNFGGLDIDPIKPFHDLLHSKLTKVKRPTDPDCEPIDLVYAAIKGENVESNSRYLLLITENYSVVDMLQNYLTNVLQTPSNKLSVIFGSSFPKDLTYTEIFRNISLIKHSMEIGNTVILLNLNNLYESLYDALNQYYYDFAGQRHVYLGLGTQRVICCVHENFRLIIVSDKESVYNPKRFPIPLLNRLEKHFLNASSMLDDNLKVTNDILRTWVATFVKASSPNIGGYQPKANEIFVGFHEETIPTLLLYFRQKNYSLLDPSVSPSVQNENDQKFLIKNVKQMLLKCATTDSVVRLSLSKMPIMKPQHGEAINKDDIWNEYFSNYYFNTLDDLLEKHIVQNVNLESSMSNMNKNLIQVTTHSNFFSNQFDLQKLVTNLNFSGYSIGSTKCCNLKEFSTQQQFILKLKEFLMDSQENNTRIDLNSSSLQSDRIKILVVQCDFNKNYNGDLLSCTRYTIEKQIKDLINYQSNIPNVYICLVVNLSRENTKNFVGFQVSNWSCYHIDELDQSFNYLPHISYLKGKLLSSLFEESLSGKSENNIDLKVFYKKIAYQSCSFIVDTNISRTMQRIALVLNLVDNDAFFNAIFTRLIDLQKQKESNYMNMDLAKNWLYKEAADIKNINEYSTLKKSCQFYIENKLSPIISFILSKIDLYSNMDIYFESINNEKLKWKADLWILILKDIDFFKLNYQDMRISNNVNNEEIKEFICKSDWKKKKLDDSWDEKLKPEIPFFWIIVDKLNQFLQNFREKEKALQLINSKMTSQIADSHSIENLQNSENYQNFIKTIPNLFEKTVVYELLSRALEDQINDNAFNFLNSYINDFLLVNCPITNNSQLTVIKKILQNIINSILVTVEEKANLKLSFPVVNFVYESLQSEIDDYLRYSNFEPDLNKHLSNRSFRIGKESCLLTINLYERRLLKKSDTDFTENFDQLGKLLKYIKSTLYKSYSKEIEIKYNLLRFYYLFHKNVLNISYKNKESLNDTLTDLANILKVKYLKKLADDSEMFRIDVISEYLETCVAKVRGNLFQENSISKCCRTQKNVYGRVLTSDCECHVCSDCELIMRSKKNSKNQTMCLSCKKQVKINREKFDLQTDEITINLTQIAELDETYKQIIDSLNLLYFNIIENFFIKNNKELILEKRLVDYIMKTLTATNKRSLQISLSYINLIIQSLLVNNEENVCNYLQKWFHDSLDTNRNEDLAIFIEKSLGEKFLIQILNKSLENQLEVAERLSRELDMNLIAPIFKDKGKIYNVGYLIFIIKLKFCIKILAKATNSNEVFETVAKNKYFEAFNSKMKAAIEHSFVTTEITDTIFNYLIKVLIRTYGSQSVKYVMSNQAIKWMIPDSLIGDELNSNDKYILIGDKYKRCKDAINNSFKEKNSEAFNSLIEHNKSFLNDNFPILVTALYRNVTTLYKDIQNLPIDLFESVLNRHFAKYQEHWSPVLNNRLNHNLKISKENVKFIDLNFVLIQLKYSVIFSKSNLIKPLAKLITSVRDFNNSFLPTMPQDNIFDIHQAVRAAIAPGAENPTFYACPNGHPYVLFNCGRPAVIYQCQECNAQIGGTSHVLLNNNRRLDVNDNTARGYALTEARQTPEQTTADRLLSTSAFQLTRFILHACLYFSCDINEEYVQSIMTYQATNLKNFFWEHMNLDLRILCKAMNINLDEINVILHLIANDILRNENRTVNTTWQNKEERQKWESVFNIQILAKYLTDPSTRVAVANKQIMDAEKDNKKNENQKLYFMAYELTDDKSKKDFLYENKEFWKYEPVVDFEVMKSEFNMKIADSLLANNENKELNFLNEFIKLEKKLKCLQHMPNIIMLLNILKSMFYKNLFRFHAENYSIKDILEKEIFPKEFTRELLNTVLVDFEAAWNQSKQFLFDHIQTSIIKSPITTQQIHSHKFNMDTKLAVFLPTLKGDGFYIYSLLHYMSKLQNEILEFYYRIKNVNYEELNLALFESSENVIKFTEFDLVKIVKANFQFISKDSKYLFDFKNISQQIGEKIFNTKPLVNLNSIELFEYADEANDSNLFNKLDDIIKQKNIEPILQIDIFGDFKTLNETSEALNICKIIINYSKAASPNSSLLVADFIQNIYSDKSLKNVEKTLRFNITKRCNLSNLKNLWTILMMKRAYLLTINNQNPLENLSQEFKDLTDVDLLVTFEPLLVLSLSMVIFQLINLQLNAMNEQDLTLNPENSIKDVLCSLETLNILEPENLDKIINLMPENIKLKSLYVIWLKLTELMKRFD